MRLCGIAALSSGKRPLTEETSKGLAQDQGQSRTTESMERSAGMKPRWLAPAVRAVKESSVIVITAGAGMSADSGLPTFRSKEGFWRAYPPAQKAGLSFAQVSNPATFYRDERLGWGFFGHRYHLYTNASPHSGYDILLKWCQEKNEYFVFTSNVDGMFERAKFSEDRIYECHGSIHYVQALNPNEDGYDIVPATTTSLPGLKIDEMFHAQDPLPMLMGTATGKPIKSRPNILMFGDDGFVSTRVDDQEERLEAFYRSLPVDVKLCIIELGAGNAVPTVRRQSESLLRRFRNAQLLRINIDEPEGPTRTISIPLGAKAALHAINTELLA